MTTPSPLHPRREGELRPAGIVQPHAGRTGDSGQPARQRIVTAQSSSAACRAGGYS
jgi:hypothetical protein